MHIIIRIFSCVCILGSVSTAVAHDGHASPSAVQPIALAQGNRTESKSAQSTREVRLLLVDGASQSPLHGLLRISDAEGNRLTLPNVLPRSTGISERAIGSAAYTHFNSWYVLPEEARLVLPRERLTIEAFGGLESALSKVTVDFREEGTDEIRIPLEKFYDRRAAGLVAGNPHLHLQRMTGAEAEAYTVAVAAADALDLAFFSYLERAEADKHYISNSFTRDDLNRFYERSGIQFGYGEEYRHNFVRNEGYGHVMFLDLWEPILPASFGPSIAKTGYDDGVLRSAILKAHEASSTVLWCHNTRGLEDIPTWLAGLLHGQLFFEQDSAAPNDDGYYSYLNIGLKVPLATGTDWFFRDMAMTYVETPRPFDDKSWLAALRAGKSYMTNGPLLSFSVNDKPLGSSLEFDGPTTVSIKASAQGRVDFRAIEVLKNGVVIQRAESTRAGNHFTAELSLDHVLEESAWLALRIPPITVNYDRPETTPAVFNEYGKPLFAHTSPVYVALDGKDVFVPAAAKRLREQVMADKKTIIRLGDYSSDMERDKVLALYDKALEKLEAMMKR